MKCSYREQFFALTLMCAALPAAAGVIGFDDIDASASDIALEGVSPYQGFAWGGFSAYTSVPGFPGFNNGIVSSLNGAYTAGDVLGAPLVSSITRASGFDFTSLYLGSGWYDGLPARAYRSLRRETPPGTHSHF